MLLDQSGDDLQRYRTIESTTAERIAALSNINEGVIEAFKALLEIPLSLEDARQVLLNSLTGLSRNDGYFLDNLLSHADLGHGAEEVNPEEEL